MCCDKLISFWHEKWKCPHNRNRFCNKCYCACVYAFVLSFLFRIFHEQRRQINSQRLEGQRKATAKKCVRKNRRKYIFVSFRVIRFRLTFIRVYVPLLFAPCASICRCSVNILFYEFIHLVLLLLSFKKKQISILKMRARSFRFSIGKHVTAERHLV